MNGKLLPAALALVTDQFACERIIKASRLVADLNKTDELFVLNIAKPDASPNPKALEHLFGVAKEYNAQMALQFSNSVESAVIHFIREHQVICVVTDIPENLDSVLVHLWERLPNTMFYTVSPKGILREVMEPVDSFPRVKGFYLRQGIQAGEL